MRRRTLLKAGLGAAAGAWCFPVSGGRVGAGVALPDTFDEVDRFHRAHAIRDGRAFPAPAPTETRDVVIIGGGISGLTALYRLRDLDTVLLEKEPEVGGNSRRRLAHGVQQPLGAIVSRGPVAPFTAFFTEIGARFRPIPDPQHAYFLDDTLVRSPLAEGIPRLPLAAAARRDFCRAAATLEQLLDPQDGVFFPRAENRAEIRALDRMTFEDWLGQQGLRGEAGRFLHLMLSARLGATGENISAWYALYILSGLRAPTYTMPGGHGAISELLADRAEQARPGCIRGGTMVTRVANRPGGGVLVSGIDAHGEAYSIAARCAIIAAPKVIAKHLVPGLREARPDIYDAFQYNAYLVARVTLAQRPEAAFEVCCRDLFSRFLVAADWLPENRAANGVGCLGVYVPMPGKAGRTELLHADARETAARIVADVRRVYPEAADEVLEVRLHRWGHPMISPVPGMDPLLARIREPFGDVIFAHSDTFGIVGLYSAVWTGMDAETEVRLRLLGV